MLGVTLFGIFLTPVFYSAIQWFAVEKVSPEGSPQVVKEGETREPDQGFGGPIDPRSS
jgi:hypothetical protein